MLAHAKVVKAVHFMVPTLRLVYQLFELFKFSKHPVAIRYYRALVDHATDDRLVEEVHQHIRDSQRLSRTDKSRSTAIMREVLDSGVLQSRGMSTIPVTEDDFVSGRHMLPGSLAARTHIHQRGGFYLTRFSRKTDIMKTVGNTNKWIRCKPVVNCMEPYLQTRIHNRSSSPRFGNRRLPIWLDPVRDPPKLEQLCSSGLPTANRLHHINVAAWSACFDPPGWCKG